MKIAITGGTGFLGQQLVQMVDSANVLTRSTDRADKLFASEEFADSDVSTFEWSSGEEVAPTNAFEGIDAIVHLLGESVQGRWTDEKKKRIRDSRVDGTRNLVDGLSNMKVRPPVLIGGSAVGFYGDRDDEELTESHESGNDFLADVCRQWESETDLAIELGMRVVNLRTGVVLGEGGGAYAAMKTPFQFCLGGKLGSGKQWFPWIHIDDICNLILFAIENGNVSGPLNGSAPQPVRNVDFTKALAKSLSRPALIPVPKWLLRTVLGEFAVELLSSRRVVPEAAEAGGFEFKFPTVQNALNDLAGK